MNRRPRRSGINFIENDKDRQLTYFKRRNGLYKSASDLSTLTGAKVAIVLEAESGMKYAFDTASSNSIVDSFLSQSTLPPIDEEETARIIHLQNELFQLEKDTTVAEKRERETKARLKEILETSGVAKLVCDDLEDLGPDEFSDLVRRLGLVKKDINNQVKVDNKIEVSGQGGPSLPLSSSSCPSQIQMPSRSPAWAPLQASSQHPSSWAPSLLEPAILQSEHALQLQQQQHKAHMMPLQPNILQTQPLPLPQQVHPDLNYANAHNSNLNPVALPDKNLVYTNNIHSSHMAPPQADQHPNSHNFAADGQLSDGYQWPPLSPYSEPYFDANLHGLNVQFGHTDDNVAQAADGSDNVHGPSDVLDQQAYDDCLTMNLLESPVWGENSDDAAANYLWSYGPS